MLCTEMVLPLKGACISNGFYWTAGTLTVQFLAQGIAIIEITFLTVDVGTFYVERLKCDIVGITGKRLTVLL